MIPFPDISPELYVIPIGERGLPIRWYALAYLAGLVLGALAIWRMMKSDRIWGDAAPMPASKVEDLLTWIVGGVFGRAAGFRAVLSAGLLSDPSP